MFKTGEDRGALEHLVNARSSTRDNSGLGYIGAILALSFAGPLIAKLIERTFHFTLFGDPNDPDPEKQKGLLGAFFATIKGFGSSLFDRLFGTNTEKDKVKTDDTATVTPVPATPKAEYPQLPTGSPERTPDLPVSLATQVPATTVNKGSQIVVKGAVPTEAVNNAIKAASIKQQIDYALLYAVAGAESSFRATASAGTSSAQGLFQFTTSTWNYLVKTVYPDLKYEAKDRLDPNKSSTVAARYLASIQTSLTKFLGKAPSVAQIYLGYFMGPTGARKFLAELDKDPKQLGSKLFPSQARSNKNLFFSKAGPLTLQQTLDMLAAKVGSYYAYSGATQESQQALLAKASGQPNGVQVTPTQPVSVATATPAAVPMTLVLPSTLARDSVAKSIPVAQLVTPSELPTKNKVQRHVSQDTSDTTASVPQALPDMNTRRQLAETTYVRDRQGRIFALPG